MLAASPAGLAFEGMPYIPIKAAMSEKRYDDLTDLSVIGVDIGKYTFHLVGFDSVGQEQKMTN